MVSGFGMSPGWHLWKSILSSLPNQWDEKKCMLPADRVAKVVDRASGTWAARRWVARVRFLNTPLVLANVAPVAVGIPGALWSASCYGVRLRYQSISAPTDRVSIWARGACGSWSTRRWMAWILRPWPWCCSRWRLQALDQRKQKGYRWPLKKERLTVHSKYLAGGPWQMFAQPLKQQSP